MHWWGGGHSIVFIPFFFLFAIKSYIYILLVHICTRHYVTKKALPFRCLSSIENLISHRGMTPLEPLKTNFPLEEKGNLLSISTSRAAFRGPLVLLALGMKLPCTFLYPCSSG